MTTFSSIERKKLERLLVMGTGWVLDFSDRTFAEFFREHGNVNIDDEKYRVGGSSKANRMRTFWAVEGDHLVAQVIDALIEYGPATRRNLL